MSGFDSTRFKCVPAVTKRHLHKGLHTPMGLCETVLKYICSEEVAPTTSEG
jgi:hypothetical protein